MDKTQIDLDELVFVLEWHSDETASYLDVEIGQIVRVSDLFDDEDDLYDFPDVQNQWYKFHNKQLIQMAREWLEAEEIDAELVSAAGPRSDPG